MVTLSRVLNKGIMPLCVFANYLVLMKMNNFFMFVLPSIVIVDVISFFFLLDEMFDTYPSRVLFYFVIVPLIVLTINFSFYIFASKSFPTWPVHFDIMSIRG